MPDPAISRLGYALLGLIRVEARSGYALRMVFETTPMGNYSSSPGSIYPALKALEKAGLVLREPPTGAKGVFQLTQAGEAALAAWFAAPVEEVDVARRLDLALLRFAFLEQQPDPALTLAFLASLGKAAQAVAASLEAFLAGAAGAAMSLQSRLAVEHGIRSYLSTAEWAADARTRLEEAGR